ncbi:hypothetical protein [Propionivibrio sp.]|uniref:hypothetical protein n=1 Tax=Propionivibrio sp. TaxID=2212460 RepID=UPI002633E81D|nr:hypothetical protein [Propionivibrio sp.]
MQRKSFTSKLAPAAPESSGGSAAKKRKRLAKVFPRPLDKKLKEVELVREKFSMREDEHAQLVDLKQRLAALGITVKKSEMLRAGLLLLVTLDDDDLKDALTKLPAIG